MMKQWLQALRSLIPSLFSAAPSHTENEVESSAYRQMGGIYVIDVRTEAEWKSGHIEGAILIPHDRIKSRISAVTLDKSAPIALYCRTGRRAGIALTTLRALGYESVENLGSLKEARKKLRVAP